MIYYDKDTRKMIQGMKDTMIEIHKLTKSAIEKNKSDYRTGACRDLDKSLVLIEGMSSKLNYNEFKEHHNKSKEYRDTVREMYFLLIDISKIWDSVGICGTKPSMLK